jgi:3-oxoacyl-(acyl-carrier-protein) synthase
VDKIVVTGIGVISAIGNTVLENHLSLRTSLSGMGRLEMLSTQFADKIPFGEVKLSTEYLKQKLGTQDKGLTRTTLLALHAFNEAIEDASLSEKQISSNDTALIGASTVGGMCLTDEMYRDANSTTIASEYLSSYDFASPTLYLQKRFGITGLVNTINTACSSSANAIMHGAKLIKHGYAKRAIVGGTDSLAKFTINGFNSLGILSNEHCRPFDENRKGLNLGEGAAFLVLEKEKDRKNKKAYAELSGYFNANDAFHPSSLSEYGDGPCLSMQGALNFARLSPKDIGFINAHGTGTENNDLVESRAMLKVFTEVPDFASTKSNTGHTLGAAGAIEAVYSILNLHGQEIYARLHFDSVIPETGLTPNLKYTKKNIHHVLSNSFGFGGNCSSLIFSKI